MCACVRVFVGICVQIFLLLSFRGSVGDGVYLSFSSGSGSLLESLSRMACVGGGSAIGHFPRKSAITAG